MIDLREQLHGFLTTKTTFEVINAMSQYNEPQQYVSYYFLNEDIETITSGIREYNATNDNIDVTYAQMPLVTAQIDVRGNGSFTESRNLLYGFQIWQDELKALGIGFRGTGPIGTIPNIQNGYVKERYQFNVFLDYDTSIVSQVEIGELISWQLIDKQ